MANVTINITRDNGSTISGTGKVPDELVAEIGNTLATQLTEQITTTTHAA